MFPQAEVLRVGDSKSAPSPRVLGGESGDQEAQLRDIARLIKQRLKREPELRPSDFAIAFRQVVPHLALARQVSLNTSCRWTRWRGSLAGPASGGVAA